MLFLSLKYLQSTHYFQRLTDTGHSVYPQVTALPEWVRTPLGMDTGYVSETARHYDLSWRAVACGYIGEAPVYTHTEPLPVIDEYRFVKKYFHPGWAVYMLLLRLLSLKNPIRELQAWLRTRKVKREPYYRNPVSYPAWDTFVSPLLASQPKVSVVIPTLNRYAALTNVLRDLEKQDYTHMEVIVVDQSDDFQAAFYAAFALDIKLIRQEEKALWLARNTAIQQATGSLIALSEDDVRIGPDWLSQHIKALDFFKAEVSAGVFYPQGESIPPARAYFALATQFATGNALLYRRVFKKTGLFDRQFEKQRMGDGEFGMRLYLQGIKSISNPYASCLDVKAPTGGLREMGSWDAYRPSRVFAPRPLPSVTYYYRRYFGNRAARLALLKQVPLSVMPYAFKHSKPLQAVGVLVSVLLLPLLVFQVWQSWRLGGKKLKEGSRIDGVVE